LFIKQKMTLFQVNTIFQHNLFDFKPNYIFKQKNSIILNLFGLDVVCGNFKFYVFNDVEQVIQKIIKK